MAQRERFPVGPFFKASLKTHSVAALCDLLHSGRIVQHGLIPWGSNYTFLVTMDVHQPYLMLAVYKPRRGETPLWDFPNGTLYRRERAAFVLSEALGWRLVPPTIIRHGPNGVGSLQLYVHHREEDADYFALHERHGREMQAMAAFDLISNNTDRKAGHCLRDEEGHVWGIDHGLTFHADPKLRTVIWDFGGRHVPKRLLRDVRRVRDDLQNRCGPVSELDGLLFPEEIDALAYRMLALLKTPEFPCLRTRRGVPWPFY